MVNGEKLLSHVWLFMTPWTVAYQALPPWDFPGKNTGATIWNWKIWDELSGYSSHIFQFHFIPLIPVKWSESCSVVSDSLWPHGLYGPWNSLGQNTIVGSPSLLQGIFPTQGLNPGLSYCRRILYQPSYQGSLINSSGNHLHHIISTNHSSVYYFRENSFQAKAFLSKISILFAACEKMIIVIRHRHYLILISDLQSKL